MSLPTLTGTGRLTDDPELRFTSTGKAVCKVRLAFSSRRKDEATGEWSDGDVYYVDGAVWGQEAENVAESLTRGAEVVVTGQMKTRSYETKQGEKRTVNELTISSIGPSLRYATAKVQKMARSSGGGTVASGDDPWATAAPASRSSANTSRAATSFDDEPPF